MNEAADPLLETEVVARAFGTENRNLLIDRYFANHAAGAITLETAWVHVYRLLLWSDPTTGLAHCYESDKSQPGKPWYARSLAYHDWICRGLGVAPSALASHIDWLFLKVCEDLAAVLRRRERALRETAARQRQPFEGRDFPEPGADPELADLIEGLLGDHLSSQPSDDTWRAVTQGVRQYLAVQNKRKNLVGEGFEDVLAQTVRRACQIPADQVSTRTPLDQIPGFHRVKRGAKENRVDLAIVRPSMRTIVTAKWSVRADREKQFHAEYDEYCQAESDGEKFEYVFVTNEFDPARLMRACESMYSNNLMFDHVVHINTNAILATYGDVGRIAGRNTDSQRRVMRYIDEGRLISLERWLALIAAQ